MKKINKKTVLIISLVFITIVLLSYLASTLLLREKPTLPSKATGTQGPTCPESNSGFCSWSSDESATSFDVKIIDQTTSKTVLEKITDQKKVNFTPIAGHSYKCTVVPVNTCGKGPEESDTVTCKLITGTPPPSETPTLTPIPTETPEISVTPTLPFTPSPTDKLTETPSPIPELTGTPVPSVTPNPSETPEFTHTPSPTKTKTPTPSPQLNISPNPSEIPLISYTPNPSSPTIPESGTPANWLFIFIPVVIIMLGLIF